MGEKNNRPPEQEVTAYKGFDVNLQCRGFQFEVGETYLHEEEVQACESGFHACEYPLDVFKYYPPAKSRFARVTQSGQISRHGEDSKVASSVIRVDAEIGLPDLVQAAVAYTASLCAPCGALPEDGATGERGAASATGELGAASATGDLGAASATGERGAASATGELGAASATGYRGAASATGDLGAASATGERGAASATGYRGAASATGDLGAASATGDLGAASATGERGAASATGERGAASATGYRGAASATGERGAASATGERGAASATGERGAASATGERGAAWVSGKNSVACAFGTSGRAKAAAGGAVVLCHRSEDGAFVHIRACKVGENGIQPDTWYSLDAAGNFFEVQTQQPLKDA